LIEKATGAGIAIIANPPALHVALKAADTAGLAPAVYYHEACVILASGLLATVMSGEVRLDPAHR
jgi:hypothetical protein